jgi:quercetin dioxygenase-like cupin family protein
MVAPDEPAEQGRATPACGGAERSRDVYVDRAVHECRRAINEMMQSLGFAANRRVDRRPSRRTAGLTDPARLSYRLPTAPLPEEIMMRLVVVAFSVFALGGTALSFAQTPPGPSSVLKERTSEIPKAAEHEARMVVAEIAPQTEGRWHTHPAPVFIYVIEGNLVYEIEGREPREYKAGMGFMEPSKVRNRVVNKSGSEKVRVVAFQVSDPNTPFME